jgi:hypothetical protein
MRTFYRSIFVGCNIKMAAAKIQYSSFCLMAVTHKTSKAKRVSSFVGTGKSDTHKSLANKSTAIDTA